MSGKNQHGTIIQIGDILVSEEVVTEFFACDYEACRGKCCIVGESGAPLKEEELEPLERYYDDYSPLMTDKGRAAVDQKGFFEIDRDGISLRPWWPMAKSVRSAIFPRAVVSVQSSAGSAQEAFPSENPFHVLCILSVWWNWAAAQKA